jgi:hypothetical protein
MAYSQNIVKYFYIWSWRKLQTWKNEMIKKIIDYIIIKMKIFNSSLHI